METNEENLKWETQGYGNIEDIEFEYLQDLGDIMKEKAELIDKFKAQKEKLNNNCDILGEIIYYKSFNPILYLGKLENNFLFINFSESSWNRHNNFITIAQNSTSYITEQDFFNENNLFIISDYNEILEVSDLFKEDKIVKFKELLDDEKEKLDLEEEKLEGKLDRKDRKRGFGFSFRISLNNLFKDKNDDFHITEERLHKAIEYERQDYIKQQEEREKQQEEKQQEITIAQESNKKQYEEKSLLIYDDFKVEENYIRRYGEEYVEIKEEIKLDKKVNEVFNFEDITSILTGYRYGIFNNLQSFLLEQRVSFTYSEQKRDEIQLKGLKIQLKEVYNIQFDDKNLTAQGTKIESKKTKINGIDVSNSKINFIINRIKQSDRYKTAEMIKLLNKLAGMKVDVLEIKAISISNFESNGKNIPVEIDITIIDENNFEINLFGGNKKVDWNFIKKHFYLGGKTRTSTEYFNSVRFMAFISELGIDKKVVFEELKKIKLFANL